MSSALILGSYPIREKSSDALSEYASIVDVGNRKFSFIRPWTPQVSGFFFRLPSILSSFSNNEKSDEGRFTKNRTLLIWCYVYGILPLSEWCFRQCFPLKDSRRNSYDIFFFGKPRTIIFSETLHLTRPVFNENKSISHLLLNLTRLWLSCALISALGSKRMNDFLRVSKVSSGKSSAAHLISASLMTAPIVLILSRGRLLQYLSRLLNRIRFEFELRLRLKYDVREI